MKRLAACLQSNYKCRVSQMFVLNATLLIRGLWAIIKNFLNVRSVHKLQFFGTPDSTVLLQWIHPSQLPKAYGGLADFPEQAWPPIFPVGQTRDNYEVDHISEEELKRQLVTQAKLLPPPELGDFVRAHRPPKARKGLFAHRTFYLHDRVERRDSFNAVIKPDSEDEKANPSITTEAKLIHDSTVKENISSEEAKVNLNTTSNEYLLTVENLAKVIKAANGDTADTLKAGVEGSLDTYATKSSEDATKSGAKDKVKAREACCSCLLV